MQLSKYVKACYHSLSSRQLISRPSGLLPSSPLAMNIDLRSFASCGELAPHANEAVDRLHSEMCRGRATECQRNVRQGEDLSPNKINRQIAWR